MNQFEAMDHSQKDLTETATKPSLSSPERPMPTNHPSDSSYVHDNDGTDAAWDSLCLDPHAAARQRGREEGRLAGRKHGYQEGHAVGRTTAMDVGMELGFVRGVLASLDGANVSSERARRTMAELRELMDNFPGVNEVFREQERQRQQGMRAKEEAGDMDEPHGANVENRNDGDADSRSVRIEIQRIRAKFKLLTVQLGCPHFSLKQIMDEAAASSITIVQHSSEGGPASDPSISKGSEW